MLVIFTLLCNGSLELFHPAKLKLCTTEELLINFLCLSLATTILFSAFMNLTALGTSCKRNHKVFVFL